MRRAVCRALSFVLLVAAAPSCAAIVGDDFVIDDESGDEKGSTTGNPGCPKDECDPCSQCSCPDYNECATQGTPCFQALDCVYQCNNDQPCIDACKANEPGTAQAVALANCTCYGECSEICAVSCGGGA